MARPSLADASNVRAEPNAVRGFGVEENRPEMIQELAPGMRVRGYAYLCTPKTDGLYQRHDFTGVIELVDDSRPQIGRLYYIRLDAPIPRWFGDGWTHIHSARYHQPLEPATHAAQSAITAPAVEDSSLPRMRLGVVR